MNISDANAQPEPLAYTIRELASAIRCSERTIRRAIASGRLRTVRIGRCVRVPRESVAEFLSTAPEERNAR